MANHCLALTSTSSCVTVHTGCPTGWPLGSIEIAIRERRAHPHWETLESRPAADADDEERLLKVKAGVPYSIFPPPAVVRAKDGARRRRPGSRRSTSAWTAYVGAARAAGGQDFPEPRVAGSVQWLSSSSLADGTRRPLGIPSGGAAVVDRQVHLALPGPGGLKSSVGGPHGLGACPGTGAGAARGCSPFCHCSPSAGALLLRAAASGSPDRTRSVAQTHFPPAITGSGRGIFRPYNCQGSSRPAA
jgi:hypothetical protein